MISPASESPWLAPLKPDVVWFAGEDALRFLNDLISQEIGDMADGETRRAFLLAPQGKLLFMLWVFKEGDRFGLVSEDGRGEELATELSRFLIRVDVDIDQESRDVWLVVGEGEGFDISWHGVPRALVIGDRPDLPAGTMEDYEALRIAAVEPAWGVDVDDGTIPHESGLVPLSVDFDKGCFLGQELVARIDSRGGNTPRRLRLIDTGDGHLAAGAKITAGDKEVGTVTSAHGSLGLAMVRREVAAGDEVMVDGVAAVVRDRETRDGD